MFGSNLLEKTVTGLNQLFFKKTKEFKPNNPGFKIQIITISPEVSANFRFMQILRTSLSPTYICMYMYYNMYVN
jgi:hypothetical protein